MIDALRQSSVDLVEALTSGDLEAAARALQLRSQAIAQGDEASDETFALGEHAIALLQNLKLRAGAEAARLRQLQEYSNYYQHFT